MLGVLVITHDIVVVAAFTAQHEWIEEAVVGGGVLTIEGEFAFGVGFYCGVDAAALGDELVEAEGESFGFATPDEHLLEGIKAGGFG